MLVKLGLADIQEGEIRPYTVGTRYIFVTRLAEKIHAMDDVCNHAGCLLSGGWLDDGAIVCPCHEYKFDVITGKNVTMPKLCMDQTPLATRIEGGELFVDLTPVAE